MFKHFCNGIIALGWRFQFDFDFDLNIKPISIENSEFLHTSFNCITHLKWRCQMKKLFFFPKQSAILLRSKAKVRSGCNTNSTHIHFSVNRHEWKRRKPNQNSISLQIDGLINMFWTLTLCGYNSKRFWYYGCLQSPLANQKGMCVQFPNRKCHWKNEENHVHLQFCDYIVWFGFGFSLCERRTHLLQADESINDFKAWKFRIFSILVNVHKAFPFVVKWCQCKYAVIFRFTWNYHKWFHFDHLILTRYFLSNAHCIRTQILYDAKSMSHEFKYEIVLFKSNKLHQNGWKLFNINSQFI